MMHGRFLQDAVLSPWRQTACSQQVYLQSNMKIPHSRRDLTGRAQQSFIKRFLQMLPNPMHLFLALSSFSTSFFLLLFLFSNASTRHVYQHQSTFSCSSVFSSESTPAKSKPTSTLHTQKLLQEQNLLLCMPSPSKSGQQRHLNVGTKILYIQVNIFEPVHLIFILLQTQLCLG